MKITKETIKKVADLAKLELIEKELETFAPQVESILEYFEKLNEVDTESINFKSHIDLKNVMGEDIAAESLNQDEALAQGKNKKGYIKVPAVID